MNAVHYDQQGVGDFIHEGIVSLTPAQMKLVLANCEFEDQRPPSQQHITVLANLMERGAWKPKGQINFALKPDGRLILVNGYHRAHAQLLARKSIVWTVTIYKCSTDAEVRALYYSFDTNLRKRGARDILKATHFAADSGLPSDAAAALYSAVSLIASRFSVTDRNFLVNAQPDLRLALAGDYTLQMKSYWECLNGLPASQKARFKAASLTALALVTFKHQKEQAWQFWNGVAQNDGLKKGDPRRALVSALAARKATDTLRMTVAQPILAWNYFFEGREDVQQLRMSESFVPKIAGTPFTGTPPNIAPPKPLAFKSTPQDAASAAPMK